MTTDTLAGRLSPDVSDALRRFPFAILLAGLATLVLLGMTTEMLSQDQEFWGRIMAGLATGAIFATGGAIFAEDRRRGSIPGLVAAYVVPLVAFAAWQVTGTQWLVPYALPVIGTLWTSVAASVRGWRGAAREAAQDRFWWLNHLAIASGAIAGIAYVVILIGTLAIGRTVDALFGVDLEMPLYRIALPAIGGFFVPLYWLSTLPRAKDFQPGRLGAPDFLIRAVAMIGKFVLIPLLLAYAAILLAYAVQIVVTRQLPDGMLGWMVLGFVTTGAGAWLVLYPDFMRDSAIVRFFRGWWFWATVVPLILYFIAVRVRIDAYGFTEERLLLIWGGLWAVSLTTLYLLRRGDIRLIPAMAAAFLLLATVGPWNVVGLARTQQAATLDNLLPLTGPSGESYGVTPDWTDVEAERARAAIQYLVNSQEGREAVRQVLRLKGFDLTPAHFGVGEVIAALGVAESAAAPGGTTWLARPADGTVDVSATANYVGTLYLYAVPVPVEAIGVTFSLEGETLRVRRGEDAVAEVDLKPLVAFFEAGALAQPFLDFEIEERRYRLVIEAASLRRLPDAGGEGGAIDHIDGRLFAGPVPPTSPTADTEIPDPAPPGM